MSGNGEERSDWPSARQLLLRQLERLFQLVDEHAQRLTALEVRLTALEAQHQDENLDKRLRSLVEGKKGKDPWYLATARHPVFIVVVSLIVGAILSQGLDGLKVLFNFFAKVFG